MLNTKCPYCGQPIPISSSTFCEQSSWFMTNGNFNQDSLIKTVFYKCPTCDEYVIRVKGAGSAVSDVDVQIRPLSSANKYPEYIPESIRNDYEEACAIVNLSPKASATLSRRCLQGMIRDFWDITDKTLAKEISLLEDKVPATQRKVLQSLRQIGNIGAHPEADVNTIIDIEPKDAGKLIRVIEFFIDKWYIDRHEQECLFDEINAMNSEMQTKRFSEE